LLACHAFEAVGQGGGGVVGGGDYGEHLVDFRYLYPGSLIERGSSEPFSA
jgi:hypothetical protein